MTRHRHELRPVVVGPVPELPSGVATRRPDADDAESLARLMLDAYRDTIDYEGEGLEEAREAIAEYLSEEPLLDASWVALSGDEIVSACLACEFDGDHFIAFVITTPNWKGRGLGGALTVASVADAVAAGRPLVHCWITEGNLPSERLFATLGFVIADP